jgi:hypothetical protein
VLIWKALYGLRSSGERWHAHFADTLRSMGFVPTRFDQDVWICKSEDGTHYEYVCTHVDDFMIVSKKPEAIMENLKTFYVIKSEGFQSTISETTTNSARIDDWPLGARSI